MCFEWWEMGVTELCFAPDEWTSGYQTRIHVPAQSWTLNFVTQTSPVVRFEKSSTICAGSGLAIWLCKGIVDALGLPPEESNCGPFVTKGKNSTLPNTASLSYLIAPANRPNSCIFLATSQNLVMSGRTLKWKQCLNDTLSPHHKTCHERKNINTKTKVGWHKLFILLVTARKMEVYWLGLILI